MRLFDLSALGIGFCLVVGATSLGVETARKHVPISDCKPKLEIGMSYNEAKIACPDLATQAYDRDNKTHQVFYMCPSQHTFIVGDLRTTRMVGFMLTPEWQDTLVIRVQANLDSALSEFDKEIHHDGTRDKKKQ